MQVAAKIDSKQVEEMNLAITFTMTVAEWRRLMREQTHVHPSCTVGMKIAEVLGHITRATETTLAAQTPEKEDRPMAYNDPLVIEARAVNFAASVILRSTDWQDVQHALFDHEVFGPWLTEKQSDGVPVIRKAEKLLGKNLPPDYSA